MKGGTNPMSGSVFAIFRNPECRGYNTAGNKAASSNRLISRLKYPSHETEKNDVE